PGARARRMRRAALRARAGPRDTGRIERAGSRSRKILRPEQGPHEINGEAGGDKRADHVEDAHFGFLRRSNSLTRPMLATKNPIENSRKNRSDTKLSVCLYSTLPNLGMGT